MLVLFHTAFKFGGIVAVSFWSMVAVFLSGIIGRFIYIQIPKINRRQRIKSERGADMKTDIGEILKSAYQLDEETYQIIISAIKLKTDTSYRNSIMASTLKSNQRL